MTTQEQLDQQSLTKLDELMSDLAAANEAQCELLREHLEGARVYLVGCMPVEYRLSLELAEEALNCVTNDELRQRIESFIQNQLSL